ncbi:MAG: TraX family protein [Cellulosilyticaceae bacterium]
MKSITLSNVVKKGFTNFDLKVIALILMIGDHLYYFFGYTEKIPVLFSQVGRLSGYIFLFVVLEGFKHTSNRKKYVLRLYGLSVLMGCMNYGIMTMGLIRKDGFYPMNNIFATFTLLTIIWQGIDYLKERKKLKGIGFLSLAIVPNLLAFLLPMHMMPILGGVMTTVLPLPMFVEGGVFWLLSGVILYVFKEHKKLQMTLFGVYTLLWTIGLPLFMGMELSISNLFSTYYEWMGIFAIPILILYNGERGKSMKRFFYIFYPAHVYIFYFISYVLI